MEYLVTIHWWSFLNSIITTYKDGVISNALSGTNLQQNTHVNHLESEIKYRIIQWFDFKYGIYFTSETEFFIFSRVMPFLGKKNHCDASAVRLLSNVEYLQFGNSIKKRSVRWKQQKWYHNRCNKPRLYLWIKRIH